MLYMVLFYPRTLASILFIFVCTGSCWGELNHMCGGQCHISLLHVLGFELNSSCCNSNLLPTKPPLQVHL